MFAFLVRTLIIAGLTSTATAQCTHLIAGTDTFGDGWNGASLDVQVNAVPALTAFTVAASADTGNFMANDGDAITTVWTMGTFDNEVAYDVIGGMCALLASEGAFPTGLATVGDCMTVGMACPPPPPANDDCANATAISGTGQFAFDNQVATTDGLDDGLCFYFFNGSINNDVWFEWTAPSSGLFTVSTSGLAGGFDTKVAVYDGGCGTESIACNDDVGGGVLESSAFFRAVASSTYHVRIGSAGGGGTAGMFDISAGATLPTVQSTAIFGGKMYSLLEPADWASSQFAAEEMGGNLVTVDNQAEHDFIVSTFFTPVGGIDMWIGLNDRQTEGTFEWADGTPVAYTNWNPGEPNNGGVGEDYAHMASNSANGTWNDLFGSSPDVQFFSNVSGLVEGGASFIESCNGDGGDQMGCTACPCGNNAVQGTIGGCLNSAGTATRLRPSGTSSIGAADLRFEASGAPPANSAVLTSGNALAPANAANPCFGLNSGVQSVNLDGLRCAVQNVLRHGVRPSDGNGDIGVTTNGWGTPNGFFNFAAFASGDTKHFQIIHRDDDTTVCLTGQNTSQAVSVTFAP